MDEKALGLGWDGEGGEPKMEWRYLEAETLS